MKSERKRIYFSTWKLLRKLVPGIRGETCANYIDRAIRGLKLKYETNVKYPQG